MAARAAVVATAVGDVPVLLDGGKAGVLVPSGDASSLADAIAHLVGSPSERLRLADAARDRVEREYTQRRMVERLLELFSACCPPASRLGATRTGPADRSARARRLGRSARWLTERGSWSRTAPPTGAGSPVRPSARSGRWPRRGYRPAVTVSTPESLAGSSRYCARRVRVPDVHQPGFAEAIEAELGRLPYVTVLPTSDTTLIALDDPGARFVDKENLTERAEAAGLPFPPSEVFASGLELVDAAERLTYPVIVKPAVGKPPRRADGPEDIAWWRPKTARLIVQPFLTEPIRTINGVMWDGRLAAVAHQRYLRVWPPDAGMALAAETVQPDLALEERVVAFLDGYSGIFELELCGPYLLDVNARVYGSAHARRQGGREPRGDLLRSPPRPTRPGWCVPVRACPIDGSRRTSATWSRAFESGRLTMARGRSPAPAPPGCGPREAPSRSPIHGRCSSGSSTR